MYNKLFVPLQHSTEVVYFSIIIWYTFTLSFTAKEKRTAQQGTNAVLYRPSIHFTRVRRKKNIQKCADLLKNFVFLCHDFQQKLLTHLLLLTI